jgi:hypothetical protein
MRHENAVFTGVIRMLGHDCLVTPANLPKIATPFGCCESSPQHQTRRAAGEASVAAAHWAMLHCGARGYVSTGAAQRRLRESYFVAIVTPATKQLRKMLADMPR